LVRKSNKKSVNYQRIATWNSMLVGSPKNFPVFNKQWDLMLCGS